MKLDINNCSQCFTFFLFFMSSLLIVGTQQCLLNWPLLNWLNLTFGIRLYIILYNYHRVLPFEHSTLTAVKCQQDFPMELTANNDDGSLILIKQGAEAVSHNTNCHLIALLGICKEIGFKVWYVYEACIVYNWI